MTKEELSDRMCVGCPYVDFDPGDYYEPPSWDCPGHQDPEDPGCPRINETLEILSEEEVEIEPEVMTA